MLRSVHNELTLDGPHPVLLVLGEQLVPDNITEVIFAVLDFSFIGYRLMNNKIERHTDREIDRGKRLREIERVVF